MICPMCGGNPLTEEEVKAAAEFIHKMESKTIPDIVEAMKKRAELANENRQRLVW